MIGRYRKIDCPEIRDGISYRIVNSDTGEVLFSGDISALLRRAVVLMDCDPRWQHFTVERITDDADPD